TRGPRCYWREGQPEGTPLTPVTYCQLRGQPFTNHGLDPPTDWFFHGTKGSWGVGQCPRRSGGAITRRTPSAPAHVPHEGVTQSGDNHVRPSGPLASARHGPCRSPGSSLGPTTNPSVRGAQPPSA